MKIIEVASRGEILAVLETVQPEQEVLIKLKGTNWSFHKKAATDVFKGVRSKRQPWADFQMRIRRLKRTPRYLWDGA